MNLLHHEPHGRASRVVEFNNVLYFEIHVAAAAMKSEMSMTEQATALLARYDELLEQYGSDKRHVIRADIIIRSEELLNEFNAVWEQWVEDGYQPTRATTTGLVAPAGVLLGIVITAARIV